MDKEFEVWFEENKKWLYSMDTMQAAWYTWSKSREAAQPSGQADLLPCGHPKSSLVQLRFGSLPYCEDCKRATSR